MTLIEISEKVRDHLTTQKKVSRVQNGCAYRGEGGVKCAVGCLIDDENYSPDVEHRSVEHRPVREAVANSLGVKLTTGLVDMLGLWQQYHDGLQYFSWSSRVDTDPEHPTKLVSPTDFHDTLLISINGGIYGDLT